MKALVVNNSFHEINYDSADELWDWLSPTKELVIPPCKLIYRGQKNAEWGLVPSILRDKNRKLSKLYWREIKYDDQICFELILLKKFMEYCDEVGINIPNDSLDFRKRNLTISEQDRFYNRSEDWPNAKLLEFMALAQHHGIPTRLLDWTRNPYAASYFSASSSLSSTHEWEENQRLAIWVLNTESINLYRKVKIIHPPGSISHHLAAQSGLFTVQFQERNEGAPIDIIGLESEFSKLPNTPLMKLTIPIEESSRLLELCMKIGISGARMYPGADGAGRAVMDSINLWINRKN